MRLAAPRTAWTSPAPLGQRTEPKTTRHAVPHANDESPPGTGNYLDEPISRPETKWRWKAKKTIAVGIAAITEAAATTFQLLT